MEEKIKLNFKHNTLGLKMPKYENAKTYMFDIYSSEEVVIKPSESVLVHTGLTFEIEEGYALMITPPVGLSHNTPLRFANSICFYEGGGVKDIAICIENATPEPMRKMLAPAFTLIDGSKVNDHSHGFLPFKTIVIKKGDVIGQATLVKMYKADINRIPAKEMKQKRVKENEEATE